MTVSNHDEGAPGPSLLGTGDIDTMQELTSTRTPDAFTTLPPVCLFSEAPGHRSIFTGKERDAESGNDYFEARYYGSSMGRFLSPDPSMLEYADPTNPQSLNLYSYVLNNPLGFIDPDGMECVWDDGSFDSATDKQTGSSKSCGKAGGTWIDPKAFSTLNAGDWSDKANANIAGIGGWPGCRGSKVSSPTNDGCPRCLAFGHLGEHAGRFFSTSLVIRCTAGSHGLDDLSQPK